MMRMNKPLSMRILLAAAALALVPMSASAWSPKLEVSDTTWVQLGYLHQFWYQSVDDGAASGDDPSNEFFTRRSRVMLLGQATENIHFFLNYDAAAGNGGGARQDPVLTDAMIDYRFSPAFNLVVGRQLVPFSIDNNTSAVTLTGIDYPTRALVNQPTNPSGAFWRDDGIQVPRPARRRHVPLPRRLLPGRARPGHQLRGGGTHDRHGDDQPRLPAGRLVLQPEQPRRA
jgi:hypothetical protein